MGETSVNATANGADAGGQSYRLFAWGMVAVLTGFLINNYLINWLGAPSVTDFIAGASGGAFEATQLLPIAVYAAVLGLAFYLLTNSYGRTLRDEAETMHRINLFIVRAAFWAVLLIGLVDATISFLRVEDLLDGVCASFGQIIGAADPTAFGESLASDLGRSQYRGPVIHMPLVLVGVVFAAFTRTLGFQWLALLVVVAELVIVLGRFVFSYEQTFMSDLVRFWYAGLFLFASAYTLYEDGHVRVDIAYAGFSDVAKGWVNAFGSLFLGALLCWVIILVALGDKTSIVNGAILNYETSQSGFGMYIKYWMASFLAVFAVTMLLQFMSQFLESVADIRREPGKRVSASAAAH